MKNSARILLIRPLLITLVGVLGCEKVRGPVTQKASTAAPEGATSGDWLGFTPYPAARQLCDEFTLAFGSGNKPIEIHWVTFATRDPVKNAIAFYSKAEKGTLEVEANSLTVHRGNAPEAVLSVRAAANTQYHTCAKQPEPEEKTIIDLSTITKP